jgi:hypothetical protein
MDQGTDWATYIRMSAYLYPAILSRIFPGLRCSPARFS